MVTMAGFSSTNLDISTRNTTSLRYEYKNGHIFNPIKTINL